MKSVSQRMSIEIMNFEIKVIVPHRDSVDFAASHPVQRALRSPGRKLLWKTKELSYFFSWLKAGVSVGSFFMVPLLHGPFVFQRTGRLFQAPT